MSVNGHHPDRPSNHLRFHHGSTNFADVFGDFHSVTPVNLVGEGHVPHLEIRTTHGLRLDVTVKWLTELVRDAPAALAKMPYLPDIHDAVGVEE